MNEYVPVSFWYPCPVGVISVRKFDSTVELSWIAESLQYPFEHPEFQGAPLQGEVRAWGRKVSTA